MNILFVGPMLGKHAGRVPNPAEELAQRLAQSGHRYWLTSSHSNRYVRLFDQLWTILRLHKQVDIVSMQVYSGPSLVVEDIVSWLVKFLGLRLVMVLHGGAMPEFIARYPGWVRRVLRRADRLVSPSHYLVGALKPLGFNITVIANGLEISLYPFRLRQGKSPRLVWLRAFHPIYQPDMAVRVVKKLADQIPGISMQMIGPGYGDASLKDTRRLIAELDLESQVEIVGYVPKPDLPACLRGGEIFLNTTSYESFGITVMEAAACGLPVVTTEVGELPLLWRNGQNALTVSVKDVAGMADAVRRILTEPNLAKRLSAAARQTAEQYDWGNILPQWEALFNTMMK